MDGWAQRLVVKELCSAWSLQYVEYCSNLSWDISLVTSLIFEAERDGFVQPGQDLGETHPESHGARVVFRERQREGEQTAMFLTRICGAERRSSSVLTSNSMLWQTKLLQSVAV